MNILFRIGVVPIVVLGKKAVFVGGKTSKNRESTNIGLFSLGSEGIILSAVKCT